MYRLTLLLCLAGSLVLPRLDAQEKDYLREVLRKHTEPVNKVAFSPDGKYLSSCSEDKTVCIYSLENTGNPVQITGFTRNPVGLAFHPGGMYLLAADGNLIKLFGLDGEYLNRFAGHATDIWFIDPSPDGNNLVSSSFDKTFRIWDFAGKSLLQNVEGHAKSVLAVRYSHHGKYIASGSLDQNIALWEMPGAKLLFSIPAHSDNIYSVDFSPDDRFLLSASRDRSVILYDLEEKKMLRRFTGHEQAVFVARFLPDGIHFLSASVDGTAKLWNAASGECLHTFTGHKGSINDLAISPDGSIFATASWDKTIRIWTLDPEIFIHYYFPGALEKALEDAGLGPEKLPGESGSGYRERQQKAALEKTKQTRDLFVKYQEMIKRQSLKENQP